MISEEVEANNWSLKYITDYMTDIIVALVIVFMNIGLFPIIGITLPFLSYGGSSLILYFLYIEILI